MKFESVSQELEYIAKRDGGMLSPKNVVLFAEDESTHLHKRFEWNDTNAANEYRIEQARRIIRLEFKIVERERNNEKITLVFRKYHSLPEDRDEKIGYRKLDDIMNNKHLRAQLLNEAFRELESFQKKYRDLKELSEIIEAIDKKLSKKTIEFSL